jgi:YHS domain-containing protein
VTFCSTSGRIHGIQIEVERTTEVIPMADQNKAKDSVCGMEIDPRTAASTSTYQGQTYYFCSPACKRTFDKNPAAYADKK